MPELSVEGVTVGYGETPVLRDVSITVPDGDIVALVGRNGVGKTTTLRTVMGVLTPSAGAVTYAGEAITGLDPAAVVRRGVGYVPEDRRMFPELTVAESLQLSAYGGSVSDHQRSVATVFETFDQLADRRDAACRQLSGGEQQMLAIARALVAGADLLLLDEPTEGLAPFIVEEVTTLIEDVNDDGVGVLLVEQNVAVALEVADAVTVLDGGEVVWAGDPEALADDDALLDRHLGVTKGD